MSTVWRSRTFDLCLHLGRLSVVRIEYQSPEDAAISGTRHNSGFCSSNRKLIATVRPTKKRGLIQNGVTEKDLRDYLTANGYYGRSASILGLDLKALERPGWVQVFEFHVHAKNRKGSWEQLGGVIRADERSDLFEVTYYDNSSRSNAAREATDGMITAPRSSRHWSYWPLMTLFALMFGAAIFGAVITPKVSPAADSENVKPEIP